MSEGVAIAEVSAERQAELRRRVPFASVATLRASLPPDPPWVWEGYLAKGAVTLMAGRPKVGKSTMAKALAVAIASRAPTFLGSPISGGRVAYASEEASGTFLLGVPDVDDLWVLPRERAFPRPSSADLIAAVTEMARTAEMALCVIDSGPFWWGLADENDATAAQRAMEPLLEVARCGIAVLVVTHQRKGGGEGGEAIRGSSALAGTADVLVEIERAGDDAPDTARRIVAVGRFPHTPAVRVVSFTPETRQWAVIGDARSRAESSGVAWRERLLKAIPTHDPGIGYRDLETTLDALKRNWLPSLNALCEEGLVTARGRGVKGDPKLYRKASELSGPGFRLESRPQRPESGGRAFPFSGPSPMGGPETNGQLSIPAQTPGIGRNGKPELR